MIWRNRCLLVLQNSKIQALPIQLGWNGSLIHFRVSRGPRCSSNLEDVIHCIVNSRTSVFEPQKNQFDYGYMRMEALRRLRVSSLDQSPRIFCPMWLRPQPSGWVTLEYERFCLYMKTQEFFSCYWTKWKENVVLKDKNWQILRHVSPTWRHRSNGAAEQAISAVRGVARNMSGSFQR